MKSAVIDIGSGSVRLLLDGQKTTKMTKLGEGLNSTGILAPQAMDRTILVVKEFVELSKARTKDIYAFATEAVRAAQNRGEFLKKVQDECGIKVEVISGFEEAEIALMGACPFGYATVIDIGGASVEIISGGYDEMKFVKSLPLGMVRLTEQSDGDPNMIRAYAVSGLSKYGEIPITGDLIGVGGTFTSLAAMALGLDQYDPKLVQDYILTAEKVAEFEKILIEAGSPDKIKQLYPVLPEMRTEIITAGAIFVSELMNYLKVSELRISEADNLDGYVRYKQLEK